MALPRHLATLGCFATSPVLLNSSFSEENTDKHIREDGEENTDKHIREARIGHR